MVSLDPEVPCRDTDPCADDTKGTTSPDTGLAFTIDFGEGEGDTEEKARRFERFALRSSQRKVKSPRQDAKAEGVGEGEEKEVKRGEEGRKSQEEGRRRAVRAAWQPGREKGGGSSDTSSGIGPLRGADKKREVRRKSDSKSDKSSLAKMMASLSAGSNFNNVDNNSNSNNNGEENDYEEDSFDEDSEDEEEEEEGGRALSETGTYVLDKEEEEKQKARSRDLLRLSEETSRPSGDTSSYVAEWAVRHGTVVGEESLSLEEGRRRRLLPVTPGSPSTGTQSPESGPPSISPRAKMQPPLINSAKLPKEVPAPLEAAEAWRRRKNYKPVLPGSLPSRKPGPQPLKAVARGGHQPSSAPSSARSASSESSGYHSRAASATQPKTGLTKSAPSRSISSLTSKEAEFQAWRRRKNYRPGQPSPSSSSSAVKKTLPHSSSSSSSGISQVAKGSESKIRAKASSSLGSSKSNNGLVATNESMQRANSFHYENKRLGVSPAMARVDESEDETENDFYLDGDELIMPVYPRHHRQHEKYACESFSHERSPSRSRTSSLDNLVISTLHNVSSKLCLASSDILRKATKLIPEGDEDQAVTVETVQYLLEDTDLPTSPKKRTSRELSGTLKNLKKLEQVMDILNKVLEEGDAD